MSLLRSIVSSSRALVTGAKDAARFRQIASVFMTHGFGWTISRLKLRRELAVEVDAHATNRPNFADRDTGRRLVAALTELGPTWIKFGQILSTRPDLVPEALIEELKTLQDSVRAIPWDEIDQQMISNFGPDYAQAFDSIEHEALASASIGQVHRARLRDQTQVVLKIQRPGIVGMIESDIHIIHALAGYVEDAFDEAKTMDLRGIVTDFAKSLAQELDYRAELGNLQRFQRNFGDEEGVIFPAVHPSLSTHEVLCMDYIEGQKLDDYCTSNIDEGGRPPQEVVELYFNIAYEMLFIHGFFHGDLHPGNVFVTPDGRLAIIDCGMVGRLAPNRKDKVIEIIHCVLNEDLEGLARTIYSLAIPIGDVDYPAFELEAISIAERYLGGVPLSQIHVGELLAALAGAATRQRVRMPTDFTMMFKAIATTEGLARSIAPDIDPIALARPFIMKMVAQRFDLDRLRQTALSDFQSLSASLRALPRALPSLLDGLQRGRIALGVSKPTLHHFAVVQAQQQARWIRASLGIATMICGTIALDVQQLSTAAFGLPYVTLGFWTLSLVVALSLLRQKPAKPED